MSEIRTAPVKAQHIDSWRELADKRIAGSVSFSRPDSDGEVYMSWVCPCGCGHQSNLLVGNGFKPADSPSWLWDGNSQAPTLSPSVHQVGHWHGWLRNGIWESC